MQNTFVFDHVLSDTLKYMPTEDVFNCRESNNQVGSDTPNLGLLMLPPPKRFLLAGSTFHTSPDTMYSMYQAVRTRRDEHKHAVEVESNKIRIYDDKLQLIRATFFFKRDTNMMSENRAGFNMLTYSIKKKALYSIHSYKSINGRFSKIVRRISLNKFHINNMQYTGKYVDRWVDALYNAVKKDVPDVRDECNDRTGRIIALILQHRVGKGIIGLNDTLMENLGHLVSADYALRLVQKDEKRSNVVPSDEDEYDAHVRTMKMVNKLKQQTVYKFIPTLQKTGSMNKAFKILLGDSYSRAIMYIVMNYNLDVITGGREDRFISDYESLVPTTAKHILSRYIKRDDKIRAKVFIENLARMLLSMEFDEAPGYVVANWVKTMKRIGIVINWNTWKDLYRMATQLRIRVRPSRFTCINDIEVAHDAYSRLLQTTDSYDRLNLPPDMLTFIEVDAPSDYRGYKVRQLLSKDELETESKVMGHCVHGYGDRCMRGSSIIFSVVDKFTNTPWTVEYSGVDSQYMHGEGIGRERPIDEMIVEILRPLGEELLRKESKKPLSYKVRSGLRAHQLNMLYNMDCIDQLPVDDNVNQNDVDKHIEMLNCKAERLVHVNRLINRDKPPTNEVLVKLLSKIDSDEADDYLIQATRTPRAPRLEHPGRPLQATLLPGPRYPANRQHADDLELGIDPEEPGTRVITAALGIDLDTNLPDDDNYIPF